jgi:hypothetical protein
MLLHTGRWQGTGSWRAFETTQNVAIGCDIRVTGSDLEVQLEGELGAKGVPPHSLKIRVVADEVGTYTLEVFWHHHALLGNAKLDSVPNMGMLWSEDGALHVAFALFNIDGGVGCRGFMRHGTAGATWELALRPETLKPSGKKLGGNVFTLRRRR